MSRKEIKLKEKIKNIINILSKKYPDPDTKLNYSTTFELLIATILSAQTTDKQVNKVTNILFKKYNKPQDFAEITYNQLENEIKSIGLYHNKSKYIVKTSQKIIEKFDGEVPSNRKELLTLPGVGRKTANVVLACAFTKNAFPVDTHVFRVANRIGLANADQVKEVEQQLMDNIPEEKWSNMHHWLIFHGRDICKARNPKCNQCEIQNFCNFKLN